jgi:uncharacterized cofD-like protein
MDASRRVPPEIGWRQAITRTPIEHLTELLLTGKTAPDGPAETPALAEKILCFDARKTRTVVLGGGTGLSTIVGGNSQLPNWPTQSETGIKREFDLMDFIVCTTDDGGSTGDLLQSLPMIGIGDLRKLLLSSICSETLGSRYGIGGEKLYLTLSSIHYLFNFRFSDSTGDFAFYENPASLLPPALRGSCPEPLIRALQSLGTFVSRAGPGPVIDPGRHALGNIFLASAIFMAAGRKDRPPTAGNIQSGVDRIARMIGAPTGRIHAATATPGQLKFLYANGVEVYGQSKSALAQRSSPVERVSTVYWREPGVNRAVLEAIRKADLVVYAPGSLYTSIIPILQLEPIADAIRSNARALKILGANFWVQQGETDKSLRNRNRGFLVSELIEAYDRNVQGGIRGLFDVVLSANMEHIPGNILRNYALEGKSPIHLDRDPVRAMGLHPVEATLFASENDAGNRLIHHDPGRFALAIRALLYVDSFLRQKRSYRLRSEERTGRSRPRRAIPRIRAGEKTRTPLLCSYFESVRRALAGKEIRPPLLKDRLLDIAWKNRDLNPSHLEFFRGVRMIPVSRWNRSTELDNVLGYFDPKDRFVKLRGDLIDNENKLQEDFLTAVGESLLGRYIGSRRWIEKNGARCYEIRLRPAPDRECGLTDSQLRSFLALARMAEDPNDGLVFRITLNGDEGFLPPGLLFGLVYAWYLTGKGFTMEYEMTLLRWPQKSLIPMHARERIRKEALVTFFREEIFGHSPH